MKDNATDIVDFGVFPIGEPGRLTVRTDTLTVNPSRAFAQVAAKARGPFRPYRHLGKRALDIAFVLLTLPFSLTIIGLCALALWIEGGNPFYTQPRLGRKGKQFPILKLRTMVRDADAVLRDILAQDPEMRQEWEQFQKLRNDPRVTRVGHILRVTSMDELPQLYNVLRGDMSFVGPRPMMPDQLGMYGDSSAYFALRPGITGLWQVSARNASRFNYRNEVDAAYERGLSFKLDLTILFKTIGVVLRPTGH
ncbi:sugar transferase [Marimonas sp. MJW-29]|uniref:Sugar transferase n=1 Tax=Sulfitobacter sediminis TaxID=3234186 RepID=A0ABV3RK49_9RHOB